MDQFKVVVSAVVLNDRDEVLLGRRSLKEEIFPGLWGIPGGKVEAEEDTPDILARTLIREAQEELGITINPKHIIESTLRASSNGGKIYIVFTADHTSGTPKPLEDTEEVRWWKLADLNRNELTPGTFDNISQAIQLKWGGG